MKEEDIVNYLVKRDGDYYIKVKYDEGDYALIGIDNETAVKILTNETVNTSATARAFFTMTRREILKFLENDTKILSERISKKGLIINHYDYFADGVRNERN